MFNDFLISLGEETSAVTIITSCFFCALSFAGLFSNTLFKKFSIRSVGIFGGSIYFIGSLLTIFVTSVEQLIISFSVFQGKKIWNSDALDEWNKNCQILFKYYYRNWFRFDDPLQVFDPIKKQILSLQVNIQNDNISNDFQLHDIQSLFCE